MTSLLGLEYASSDEEVSFNTVDSTTPKVNLAPDVADACTALTYNVPNSGLARPVQGPSLPCSNGGTLKRKMALTGDAEETAISDSTFTTNQRTYESLGYARDPTVYGAFVGDLDKAQAYGGKDIVQTRPSREQSLAFKRRRQKRGDASIVHGEGAYKGPWAKHEASPSEDSSSEDQASEDQDIQPPEDQIFQGEAASREGHVVKYKRKDEQVVVSGKKSAVSKLVSDYKDAPTNNESTIFHGIAQYDYQGRTYMHVPRDLDINLQKEPGTQTNYIPKKLIHSWNTHTGAINAIRFFPNSGHLLLSASADTKVKLYDVYHDRELLRTYSGHTKSVSDTTFSPTGTHLLSGSHDRFMKLWDTETGGCISRFQTPSKALPHVLRFHPSTDTHAFLVGTSDKKIVQFDTRSGEMTQEYDHHLQAVNTITFCDDNRRFITTSDDKSLRAWEYDIPVPIKYIAEPYMYPMIRAAAHPNGKSVAFQSLDNQIVVYASTDRFRQNRKKSFRGHNNAGQAIDVDISPDGQFVVSGDSGGYVCFWDWKTCKMWHKIKADEGPVVRVAWHPQESSKLVTAGLEGTIKYWD
ncbi:MAG: hypothetical protein Q9176_003435 [Flavoplaca citrina]